MPLLDDTDYVKVQIPSSSPSLYFSVNFYNPVLNLSFPDKVILRSTKHLPGNITQMKLAIEVQGKLQQREQLLKYQNLLIEDFKKISSFEFSVTVFQRWISFAEWNDVHYIPSSLTLCISIIIWLMIMRKLQMNWKHGGEYPKGFIATLLVTVGFGTAFTFVSFGVRNSALCSYQMVFFMLLTSTFLG
jgi:hypothetical protein